MFKPDDFALRIATHESGHAFTAVVVNLPLARVRLHPNPRYDLRDGLHLRDPATRLDRIRVLMGGAEAERVIFGDAIGDGTDLTQIAELLIDDDDEIALRDQVRELLALNAGTLRWLASKLMKRGRLDGDEVERAVRC
jgi:ATP-dependent Zn protease